jgi:hypothetical protein
LDRSLVNFVHLSEHLIGCRCEQKSRQRINCSVTQIKVLTFGCDHSRYIESLFEEVHDEKYLYFVDEFEAKMRRIVKAFDLRG